MFPRLFGALFGPSGSLRLIVLLVLLALGVAIGHRGRRLAASDLAERDTTIQPLRSEGESETRYNDQLAQLVVTGQADEHARRWMRSRLENTYHINPNQSLLVADHLTIGPVRPRTKDHPQHQRQAAGDGRGRQVAHYAQLIHGLPSQPQLL
jgi:hypothetical protein